MFKLLIFACAIAANCDKPERIEVVPIQWETLIGCTYAASVLSSIYELRVPGYEAKMTLCLPEHEVEPFLSSIIGPRA